MLHNALVAGINGCGATVLQQGIVPTPVLAYLTGQTESNAGAMVTASHNPPEYNGIKLYNADTTAYNETQQSQIESVIARREFKLASWQNIGKTTIVDETMRYVRMVTEAVKISEPWRIIVDSGNGAACHLAPKIFHELGCEIISVNSHPDGHFPGRTAEPNEETLQPLCSLVRKLKANLGIAYDGDGDRMVAVDEKGRMTSLDRIFAAYAAHVIKHQKNSRTVITHVEASMCVEKAVEAEGGRVVRTKVGDVNITEAIKKHKAVFGGEPCGAWIHPNYHYCPDGILSSILLVQALEETGQTLSQFVSKLPRYALMRQNISCPKPVKSVVLEKTIEVLPTLFLQVEKQSKEDGFRLTLKEGWILIRPSGTESLIRITVEAENRKTAERIMIKAARLVNKLIRESKC